MRKTPNCRKFWEVLLFQWPCSVTLLLLAILKKSRIFSKTQSIFFQKKTNSWTFWEILQNWLLSASNWLLSAICKKTQSFFSKKPIFFSQEEATLSTFSEILLNQLHPTTIFLTLAVFKKVNFFQKPLYFTWKKPNFEHFEKFIHSVAMYSEFATFSNFSVKKVFVRNEPIFFSKPQIFERFEDSYLFSCILVQVCPI